MFICAYAFEFNTDLSRININTLIKKIRFQINYIEENLKLCLVRIYYYLLIFIFMKVSTTVVDIIKPASIAVEYSCRNASPAKVSMVT